MTETPEKAGAKTHAAYKHASTNHTEAQLFSLQVIEVSALQAGQVMLQTRIGVGVAVCKLINIILAVETEGERHHVVPPMIRAAVVIHILGWKSLPVIKKERKTMIIIRFAFSTNIHRLM